MYKNLSLQKMEIPEYYLLPLPILRQQIRKRRLSSRFFCVPAVETRAMVPGLPSCVPHLQPTAQGPFPLHGSITQRNEMFHPSALPGSFPSRKNGRHRGIDNKTIAEAKGVLCEREGYSEVV
jgi:hypothetical protein